MSNNKIINQVDNNDGTVTTTFDKSPKMVTYLVAFVISDFYCALNTNNETPVQVCASPPQKDMVSYALDISPKLLNIFGEKFNYSYSKMLPKMDIVAIPDFSAGKFKIFNFLKLKN